jgi:nuclear GTP-binding protein
LEWINVSFGLTFTFSVSTVKEILRLCPAEKLTSIYKIDNFSNVDEFLMNVAMVRGKLKKGGVVDSQAAARIVLHDWNEGKPGTYRIY